MFSHAAVLCVYWIIVCAGVNLSIALRANVCALCNYGAHTSVNFLTPWRVACEVCFVQSCLTAIYGVIASTIASACTLTKVLI